MKLLFRFSFQECTPLIWVMIWMGTITPQIHAQNISSGFSRYTIDDGLSQSLVYAITQDPHGFMWFGTKNGLSRFDGYEFKIYDHDPFDPNSLSGNAISALISDSRGRLWIGTLSGNLDRYNSREDRFSHILPPEKNDATINVITEDLAGNLWLGTYGNGIFRIVFDSQNRDSIKNIQHYVHRQKDSGSLFNDFIIDLYADPDGRLWISTHSGKLQYAGWQDSVIRFRSPELTIQRADKKIRRNDIFFDTTGTPMTSQVDISLAGGKFVRDDQHRLWIGNSDGLFLIEENRAQLLYFNLTMPELEMANIQSLCSVPADRSAPEGSLWLGLYEGAGIFDLNTFSFRHIKSEPDNSRGLLPGHVMAIYRDRSGCIWLGSNGYGLSKYNLRATFFTLPEYRTQDGRIKSENLSIRSFFDTDSCLLIGTIDGLMVADKKTHLMKKIDFFHHPGASKVIYSMARADSDHFWIGTDYGLVRYDLRRNIYESYLPGISEEGHADNRIFKIIRDDGENLWCLTQNTLSHFNIKTRVFKNYYFKENKRINEFLEPAYGDIYRSPDGNIWVGTGDGLFHFDRVTETFQSYRTDSSDPYSLSFNAVRCILPDPMKPDKYLWIGTAGGGLNKFEIETEKFTHFTTKDGLPNNVIYGILPDAQHHLWMSSNKGISRFDPADHVFRNFTAESGLQSNEFNAGAFYKNERGKLFFGGIRGFNTFYPEDIKENPYIPQVVFTDFYLFNQTVTIRDDHSPLQYPINETRKITLPYHDNLLSFKVAGMDYGNPDKNQYAYKLSPAIENWIETGTSRLITLSDLDPGTYKLHVKAANSEGLWNEEGISLDLVILPPWWETRWAYFLYFLLFVSIIHLIRKYELKRISLRNRLQMELLESRKLKELDHLKSRFFANISHEFRTPLTMIIGPLEDALRGGDPKNIHDFIPEMHRNSKRLLQLISQLLDLSRLDSNQYQIHADRDDIVPFVKKLVEAFAPLAAKKEIRLETKIDPELEEQIQFCFDADIIEKILDNLLSNAFKFTPDGGTIVVCMAPSKKKKDFLEIVVRDSGIGIAPEKLPHIFDRFYRIDDPTKVAQDGTGVGLDLMKELVNLLGGEVSVESEPGRGTAFRCLLPFSEKILPEKSNRVQASFKHSVFPAVDPEPPVAEETPPPDARSAAQVLIVEDHRDVRRYIRKQLEGSYCIREAENGEEGLSLALKYLPDIVISDVMMPLMDGFDLCERLKTDDLTCHIPVILLTARPEDNDMLQGLKTGADAYLIKPFNSRELKIRVDNLIRLKKRMRVKFSGRLVVRPEEISVTSRDEEFMKKMTAVVGRHMDDSQFSVRQLGEEMNMSVSQVNRKLKTIIGQSTHQFILSVRMHRALELLKENAGNISEVAWMVGFEAPGYFSKVFKDHFGCLPSEKDRFPG